MKKKQISLGIILIILTLLAGCSAAGRYESKGKKCFARGDYEEAAEYFTKAIAENPNRTEYYIDYGMSLIALEKYKEAISNFDLAYQEKNIDANIEKKILRGKGVAYYCKKEYKKAIKHFDQALAIDASSDLNKDILFYKASSNMAMGNCEGAVEIYTTILSSDKKDINALMNRAYCYRVLGDYENGIADYDKAIALDSDGYDCYFGKYLMMFASGQDTEAAKVLDRAAEIKDKSKEGQFNRARLHFYQGDYDTAMSEFTKDLGNEFPESYYYIGEIYRQKKNYKTAVYYYENYVAKGEVQTPDVYNQLGSCQIKLGEYKSALQYLLKGIKMNHAAAMRVLLKNEIVAYEGLQQYQRALKKLGNYLRKYPDDAEAKKEEEFLKTRVMNPEGSAENGGGIHTDSDMDATQE